MLPYFLVRSAKLPFVTIHPTKIHTTGTATQWLQACINAAYVQPHRMPHVHGNQLVVLNSHCVRNHPGCVFSHVSLTSRRHSQVGQQQLRASTTTSRFREQSQQRFSASPSGFAVTATRTAARATKRVKRMVVSKGGGEVVGRRQLMVMLACSALLSPGTRGPTDKLRSSILDWHHCGRPYLGDPTAHMFSSHV
jgi:hypothetical protein